MANQDPIALLMKEHEGALTRLHRLKKDAQELKKKGYSEKVFKSLLKAAEYVDEEVRVHNPDRGFHDLPRLEEAVLVNSVNS